MVSVTEALTVWVMKIMSLSLQGYHLIDYQLIRQGTIVEQVKILKDHYQRHLRDQLSLHYLLAIELKQQVVIEQMSLLYHPVNHQDQSYFKFKEQELELLQPLKS